jgi:heat shock protein HtpX
VNTLKVFFLMFVLTAIFLLVGDWVGGQRGMVIALVFGGLFNLVSYWFSDRIVLAMYGAQQVTEAEAPELYSIVRELATAANLPMPRLAVIPQEAPNAFATGRNHSHAVVAVTEGMMRLVNREELRGVLAHELAHVRNYDMLIGTFAATLAAAIAFLPRMLFVFGGGDREDRSPLGPLPLDSLGDNGYTFYAYTGS